MALLVRRNWPSLRDEAIIVGGGHNHTGWSSRVEQLMYEAYLDLCMTYHQHELEVTSTPTPVLGDLSLTLPADCFIVASVSFISKAIDNPFGIAVQMKEMDIHPLLAQRLQQAGLWKKYARMGNTLLFDCPLDTAQSGTVALHYYKLPVAPDYTDVSAGNTPLTSWVWDSHIIEATVAKIQGRTWTWDQAGMMTQTLQQWIAAQTQPSLNDEPMNNPPERPQSSRTQGGNQG